MKSPTVECSISVFNIYKTSQIGKSVKLIFILLTTFLFQSFASVEAQLITIDVTNTPVEKVFREIERQTGIGFLYNNRLLRDVGVVSIKVKNAKVDEVVKQCLDGKPVDFRIEKNVIILTKRSPAKSIEPESVSIEAAAVTGTVTGTDNRPIQGASVNVKGTTRGDVTDGNGKFSISGVNPDDILVFTYVGYKTREVKVGSRTVINVQLEVDIAELGRIVIVGYGAQSKESLTGSVGVVKGKNLEQVPVSTFEQALRGSVAGLQATATDGAPGANTEIRIRGIGSITASSEPLYVIDGIPIQSGSIASQDNAGVSSNVISALNPNDIESISVLKDAASTAIYGSRGANGVILITTKSGKAGKAKLSFKTLTGFNSVASKNILKPLNASQYTELFFEGYANKGFTTEATQELFDATFTQLIDPSTGKPTNTDWLKAITRTGITQGYDLTGSGGTENFKYYSSGSYYSQENYIIGSDFRRLSGRVNLEYNVKDNVTVTNNVYIAHTRSHTFDDSGSFDNPFKNSLELSPLIPIYDEQGRFNAAHSSYFPMSGANPVGSLSGDDLTEFKQLRIIDNFSVSLEFLKHFTFKTQWNFDIIGLDESKYRNTRYGEHANSSGYAYEATTTSQSYVGTQTLNYDLKIGKPHRINFLAGYEAQKSTREFHSASGTQFPNDKVRTLNSASAEFQSAGSKSEYTFVSIFSRANYNYNGKYFLSASLRRDGSSRFGSEKRWGNFYSVGASWIASKEKFLSDVSFIDEIKLRTSYGLIGNAAIGDFPSLGLYTYGRDYDGVPGGGPSQIGNPNLTWETQKNFNVGIDFGFFSRVNGTIEYFKRVSSDLILDVPISRTTGFSLLTQNFGEMQNSGVEISMNADIVKIKGFIWNVGFNTTFLKNRITRLTENYIDGAYRREEGQDFQSFYMFGWAGVDQTNGAPQWYKDASETEITNKIGEAQRYLVGKSATPDYYGGFNSSLSYKGVSLSANFIYSYGNYLFDSRARGSLADGRLTPRSTATWIYENRWVPGKTDALAPKFIWGGGPGSGEMNTSRWLYDGSYIRLRDLTLAYDFPTSLTNKLHVSSIRAFVRGTNILTFTKDRDLYIDPEQAINGDYNANTPANKTISFGLDVQL